MASHEFHFFQKRIAVLYLLVALITSLSGLTPSEATTPGNRTKYYTLYMTENRICKQCTWQWIKVDNATRIELINKPGDRTIVEPSEILEVDCHPLFRKFMLKSLSGIGLPGPVIVPYAFENSQDYVCKYCDKP